MSNIVTKESSSKKKPIVSKMKFNRKKWRDQKYNVKAKIEKWENIKRRQALRQYNKELKRSEDSVIVNKNCKLNIRKSINGFEQAQLRYRDIRQQKEEKRKEAERIKKEKIEAIKAYKEKKAIRYKKISQKTKKGQPLMKGRIELLLEKIQQY